MFKLYFHNVFFQNVFLECRLCNLKRLDYFGRKKLLVHDDSCKEKYSFIQNVTADILTSFSLVFCFFKGQFHQHFMSSFHAPRSQKCKKDSLVKQLFLLSGSECIKAEHKHVDEIDPRCLPNATKFVCLSNILHTFGRYFSVF